MLVRPHLSLVAGSKQRTREPHIMDASRPFEELTNTAAATPTTREPPAGWKNARAHTPWTAARERKKTRGKASPASRAAGARQSSWR